MKLIDSLSEQGGHERQIRSYFKRKVYFTGDKPVFDRPLVVLAFQNRSGSNLLMDYLRQTGQFNCYFELLNHPAVLNHCRAQGLSNFPDYFRFLRTQLGQPDRIDCIKASWDQLLMLLRFGIHRMYPEMRVLHLRRQDMVAQAVSYSIALQTQQWTSAQKADPNALIRFDSKSIGAFLNATTTSNGMVPLICTAAELKYLQFYYEGLCARPRDILDACGRFLGLDFSECEFKDTQLSKQANAINDAHKAQYLDVLRKKAGFS